MKLTDAQQRILDSNGNDRAYSKLCKKSKDTVSYVVSLKHNHRSAYKLEEYGYGRVACIQPFDGSFFLVYNK